ncbi:MAG: hypothetical protein WKG07_11150 [Hymenobacter sp.]
MGVGAGAGPAAGRPNHAAAALPPDTLHSDLNEVVVSASRVEESFCSRR